MSLLGSVPATGWRRLVMRARVASAMSVSPFTLKQQVYLHQGERWEADVILPPLPRTSEIPISGFGMGGYGDVPFGSGGATIDKGAEEWLAFLLGLRGYFNTFLMGDPSGKTPRGSAAGTPLVDGAGQTGHALATKGWTASASGVLKAGDYLQLGSGATTRLYKNLADANADAAGKATLDIWPALRESPADGAALVLNSAQGTFRLAKPVAWSADETRTYGIEFAAVEAI